MTKPEKKPSKKKRRRRVLEFTDDLDVRVGRGQDLEERFWDMGTADLAEWLTRLQTIREFIRDAEGGRNKEGQALWKYIQVGDPTLAAIAIGISLRAFQKRCKKAKEKWPDAAAVLKSCRLGRRQKHVRDIERVGSGARYRPTRRELKNAAFGKLYGPLDQLVQTPVLGPGGDSGGTHRSRL